MAGMVCTITEITHGTIKKIKFAWTSDDAAGTAGGTTTAYFNGRIFALCTVPDGGDAPDADYDIALNDVDGVDVLLGAGIDRHTSNTEYVAEASMGGVAHSKLTLAITAAGNSNKGTVYVYIR